MKTVNPKENQNYPYDLIETIYNMGQQKRQDILDLFYDDQLNVNQIVEKLQIATAIVWQVLFDNISDCEMLERTAK